jgi:hypothetical protein
MSTIIAANDVRAIALGIRVQTAAVTNPQTASTAIFTVAGRVLVTSLFGEVTTVQGATANSFNITYDPTVGAVGDLCAATVCTSDAAGTLYGVTGIAADLLSAQTVAGTEVPTHVFALGGKSILLSPGSMLLKASGSNTGATQWTITYVPYDNGASIVAA